MKKFNHCSENLQMYLQNRKDFLPDHMITRFFYSLGLHQLMFDPIDITFPEGKDRELLKRCSKQMCKAQRESILLLFLLVRRKDGSWRTSVDYKAFNNITVKDKYPISVMDYLMKIFTKLDLQSVYHKTRVHEDDI